MEFTASEASSIIDFASDNEMPEDPVEEPVYLGKKREKFFKVIVERGEGIDKPGTLDEVVLRFCEFSENLSDSQFQTIKMGLGTLPDYLEKGVISMKINEIIDLHVPEKMTKTEPKIVRIELQSFINIHDLHANGMLLKKVLNKSKEIDRINYKDEVKFSFKVVQGLEILLEKNTKAMIVGVTECCEGLVEVLKTMKLNEISEVTVKFEYFCQKFGYKTVTNEDPVVRLEILELVKLTDVYVNGGFFKRTMSEGEGSNPYPNSLVEIEYLLEYLDVKKQGVITAYLDECLIPSLWQDTVKLMKLYENCKVECFPNEKSLNLRDSFSLELNCPVDNPVIQFKLNKIISGAPLYDLEDEDKLIIALRMKKTAAELFKAEMFLRAIEKCELGLAAVNPVKDNLGLFQEVYISLQLNTAMSFCKLKEYRPAVVRCDRIFEISKDEIKVIYRKGVAIKMMFEYKNAIEVFERGMELAKVQGNDAAVKDFIREISQCESLLESYHKKEKKLYANLFK